MKKWAERMLGDTLETIFISKILSGYGVTGGQQYALGLSASYKENPQAPVYHYSSQQQYTKHSSDYGGHPGFVRKPNMGNIENTYSPQRKPQSQSMHRPISTAHNPQQTTQGLFIHRPIPTHPHGNQTVRGDAKTAGMLNVGSTSSTLDTDSDPGRSAQTTNESKAVKRRKLQTQSKLPVIPEGPNSARSRPRTQQSDPIPNPSGRKTPPHKRSPKKKNKTPLKVEGKESDSVEAAVNNWTKEGKNKVAKLIVNKWAKGSKPVAEKEKGKSSGNKEGSSRFTKDTLQHTGSDNVIGTAPLGNLSATSNPPSEDKTNDVAKTAENKWTKGKNSVPTKCQGLASTSGEGSSWLTNNPPPPGPKKVKNKQQVQSEDLLASKYYGSENLSYSKTTSDSSGKNADTKPPVKNLLNAPTSPTRNSHMLARYLRSGDPRTANKASKDELDYAQAVLGMDGKTKTPTPTPKVSISPAKASFPQKQPKESLAIETPSSKQDYAKAASGVNGRNEDPKTFINAPVSLTKSLGMSRQNKNLRDAFKSFSTISPSKNQSTTTGVNGENGDKECSAMGPAPLLKGPPSTSPSQSPASRKSWSSIVKGDIDEANVIIQKVQHGNLEILGYPELGKPLTTLPPNQPGLHPLQKKTSLSAEAKVFEPASIRHAISLDSYLHNTKPPESFIPDPTSVPPTAHPSSKSSAEATMTGYDLLLEILYSTPQFIEYLDKSYDWLLFKQNYLRAQYQRIQIAFEDEWNMITAKQRKAVVTRALANLYWKIDRVQFRETFGVEGMLSELGLLTPNFNRNRMTKSCLRMRAEYCFDLDPDAFAITPYWLYTIIGWLLGTPQPLRHRFGPAGLHSRESSHPSSGHITDPLLDGADFWCPDDCSQCEDSERTGSQTEWVFVGRDCTGNKNRLSDSAPSSPMMKRFLDSLEIPTRSESCEPATSERKIRRPTPEGWTPNAKVGLSSNPRSSYSRRQVPPPKINIITEPRLMSNRFQDPIFKPRSPEWIAAHPGRSQFMEIVEIDIALFYCELVEEILHIFGEIRRERVWFTLPTVWDWFNGPTLHSPQSSYQPRGRPHTKAPGGGSSRVRSMSCPVWGSKEFNAIQRKETIAKHDARLAEVKRVVSEERKRVWEFVKETQRTIDWVGCGLKLVDRESDHEADRAWDGGLWSVPVPREEKAALEEGFGNYCAWRG